MGSMQNPEPGLLCANPDFADKDNSLTCPFKTFFLSPQCAHGTIQEAARINKIVLVLDQFSLQSREETSPDPLYSSSILFMHLCMNGHGGVDEIIFKTLHKFNVL